ncbi:hypothetical protein [Nitrospira defluvii]|uniref:Uncharacterized protein n=1 Tax=Nitrospira defluvii TaxID=330214 RepID=A0ABN7MI63_9BACT|nr:hypothetical protein [Nitrospira defluvii]CAE6798723.1 conserved hypothetical protein [Nitrospira defluvii]
MKRRFAPLLMTLTTLLLSTGLWIPAASAANILIHMKTSLAVDDAQICAVPNVAWAAVKAGHTVTILVDASAVTSVTKGFGWFRKLVGSDSTALDRANLPERERQSLSEQMGVLPEQVPRTYGEYFDFLKNKLGVDIYGNQTMMLLYKIDPARVAASVTSIPLAKMVELFEAAEQILVY